MARLSKHTTPDGVETRLQRHPHYALWRGNMFCTALTSSKLNVVTNVFGDFHLELKKLLNIFVTLLEM